MEAEFLGVPASHADSYTNEMFCPYCGCENIDNWRIEKSQVCTHCGKEFAFLRNTEVTYQCFKKEVENEKII